MNLRKCVFPIVNLIYFVIQISTELEIQTGKIMRGQICVFFDRSSTKLQIQTAKIHNATFDVKCGTPSVRPQTDLPRRGKVFEENAERTIQKPRRQPQRTETKFDLRRRMHGWTSPTTSGTLRCTKQHSLARLAFQNHSS